MYPFIIINDSLTNLLEDNSKGYSKDKSNLAKYLLHIIMGKDTPELLASTKIGIQNSNCSNVEQHFKRVLKQRQPPDENQFLITVDELVPYFIQECSHRFVSINPYFANYLLHLLIRDRQDGLELHGQAVASLNICNIEKFLEKALQKYENPADATVCNMKITHFFKNRPELKLDFVKEKYELDFQEKLQKLIKNILQYPETSNAKQLEEMFVKMQMFIITNYHIGCVKNHVLLKETQQSLNSVLGKGDLQKYVLKKRYHRLEYLEKLGATVAGIIIFNNQDPKDDKENIRNIFADLQMAQCNTKETLEEALKRCTINIEKGTNIAQDHIEINIYSKTVRYVKPLIKLREINKFVILFEVYKKYLLQIRETFEKTQYLMEVAQKKFKCVVDKINEILKFRSAIESELIFPHFVYLSEVWTSLVLYLNQLVEINKIKDHLDEFLNEKLENKFYDLLEDISNSGESVEPPMETSFQELMDTTNKRERIQDMLNVKPFTKNYCALTLALTNGILIPAQLDKKLCENLDIRFGFTNMEYVKYSERYLDDFLPAFLNTIFTNSDLILFFQLDDEVMQQDFDLINQPNSKTKSLETQTEMVVENNLSAPNRINITWNVWDFHRETIKLANIRQKQTNSTQSKLCYGVRNAQNQCYHKMENSTQK